MDRIIQVEGWVGVSFCLHESNPFRSIYIERDRCRWICRDCFRSMMEQRIGDGRRGEMTVKAEG